ncbi:D-aminopeptidase [Hyphodiscus hymeniophilus]|uniref:D-aminopeptidase n=1 Tax=Hyphodiscus hymeniophilus TaxID=353542 RepID=A0A9P7AV40_9HELO|nr:D-aminopeptidase [Hyphodiscus hymeniophilus]
MTSFTDSISKILEEVPALYRGPGGAVAVLKDGKLVGQQVWGFADLDKRISMTAETILPICSISKQMVCGLLADLERNPTPAMIARGEEPAKQLSDHLSQVLNPKMLNDTGLTIRHLGNMQSGIRDYWAMTVLWGANPEGHFSIADHGPQVMDRIRSFHFKPGTEFSYSNTNFFILGRVIEKVAQQPLADLLAERIFAPAGMTTARLCAHTAEHPPPCNGYEGDEKHGFYPATNCIEWAGDAGIVASLADMTAYEQFLDSCRTDPQSWYQTNSEQQKFKYGAPADYGFGLARQSIAGVTTVGHGGGLRGYRLVRLYAPEPRISVVVMLNQEHGDPGGISSHILKKALAVPETKNEVVQPDKEWIGTYLDSESQLAITVNAGVPGELLVKYHSEAEKMRVVEPFRAQSDDMLATLEGSVLNLHVPKDNRRIQAQRVPTTKPGTDHSEVHGRYYCDQINSAFHCSGSGAMLYGSFDGFLGKGPVHLIKSVGTDVWALACPRGMDSSPPGDWTIVVRRDDSGDVKSVTIGCWLARNLEYTKMGEME